MMQLDLFASRPSIIDQLAHEGRQRIIDGVVDAWGKHNPDGPRKQLTDAQRHAHELFTRGVWPPGAV